MNREKAEQVISCYIKKLYGFALKKTANLQDAEDLTQEIALKLYSAFIINEITNINAFVWRVANNVFANYYRGKARSGIGVCIDFIAEELPSGEDIVSDFAKAETIKRLQGEIAYLSKKQRQIVILYYYEGKKQEEIAELLSIPVGTVKWHLFEAKSEMKKGLENMRNTSDLKFNPIKFTIMGLSGSVGSMGGTSNFFRNLLSQNIAYCVYREAMTINEIADCLGVSPVYVESEAEFLEEYGFLIKEGNKYLANLIIDEPNHEIAKLHDEMYSKAAKLISNELFDELMKSELLSSDKLYFPDGDKNFLAWGLLLYMLAWGNNKIDEKIKFEEVITIRKDGGKNIAYAGFDSPDGPAQKHFESMLKWFGPMWNGNENIMLWQINSEWSARNLSFDDYSKNIERDLKLLYRFINGETLSPDEYIFMAQKAYIRGSKNNFELAIIWLKDNEIKQKLLDLCVSIKEKHKEELDDIKSKYCKIVLENKPKHIRKMQAYGMQHIFHSDGWFLLYTVKELLENGRLKLPTEEQRVSLSTLIMPNN